MVFMGFSTVAMVFMGFSTVTMVFMGVITSVISMIGSVFVIRSVFMRFSAVSMVSMIRFLFTRFSFGWRNFERRERVEIRTNIINRKSSRWILAGILNRE